MRAQIITGTVSMNRWTIRTDVAISASAVKFDSFDNKDVITEEQLNPCTTDNILAYHI